MLGEVHAQKCFNNSLLDKFSFNNSSASSGDKMLLSGSLNEPDVEWGLLNSFTVRIFNAVAALSDDKACF